MGEIRIGKVSSVDYDNGMVKVVYQDKDTMSTQSLPVLSLDGEYKMPSVDQYVLVAHLSNGNEAGVVIGTYWNKQNKSKKTGSNVFRKELAKRAGEAFMQYVDEQYELNAKKIKDVAKEEIELNAKKIKDMAKEEIELNADNIKFVCSAGTITVAEIIAHIK